MIVFDDNFECFIQFYDEKSVLLNCLEENEVICGKYKFVRNFFIPYLLT